jgi:1-acyl-sn-glycerol-3-phosphate acyltransferase
VLRRLGRLLFELMRWRVHGNMPDLPRFVVIVAPHTSNWDFVVGVSALLGLDLRANWLGKSGLFKPPVQVLLRRLGGIPVDRSSPHRMVDQMAAEFAAREQLVLGIAPEGTRRKVAQWRTGFWHIARRAGVPIVPVALDYGRRVAVIGAPFQPTDSMEADILELRRRYEGIEPFRPEWW